MTEKRRRKTGCLTCRTRRVKCDERKPDCERCEIANVECSGYARKRQLKIRPSQQSPTTADTPSDGSGTSIPSAAASTHHPCALPRVTDDGLPLVALPVNPTPSQRPHARARDLLGYHQYLYRTLPILFPPKSFHFWRDFLCEAAWETEWVFDAIVALGSLHRATLLLSQPGENDRHRGQDAKIAAIHVYIKALEGISSHLAATESPTPLAVAVLVLMAYMECFLGNIPAAIRHAQVTQYYSYSLQSDDKHQICSFITPIESSIRDLELICRLVRPFPSPLEPSCLPNAEKSVFALPSSFFEAATSSSSAMLQQLLEFTSADLDLKHLVWCVYAAHNTTVSKEKVLAFLKALDDWRMRSNVAALQDLKMEESPSDSMDGSYQALSTLAFPPPCHDDVPLASCLALALFSFYKARLLWALCLLGDQDDRIELDAYMHVYEFLRYTRTALTALQEPSSSGATLPCENLRIGFSPLLYLAGRCCPSASWLRWIIQELKTVDQEGLFHSGPFATTLDILLLLESNNVRCENSSDGVERFLPPASRTIALFIPDINGRNYESYYARPQKSANDDQKRFILSQVARWSDVSNERPAIQDYEIYQQPFSQDWLMEQEMVQKWREWSCDREFDFNQVIQDHITGNRILLEVGAQ